MPPPKTDAELFLDFLTRHFGEEGGTLKIESTRPGLPDLHVFVYYDIPDEGMITGVTYGIHLGHHPDWKHGGPELIVSVESRDLAWPLAMGRLTESLRNEKSFDCDSLFTMDVPISDESEMRGFFVFAPSVLDEPHRSVPLNHDTIHLAQLYPLYLEEVEIYQEMGPAAFWDHPHFDPYDVTRPNLATEDWEDED